MRPESGFAGGAGRGIVRAMSRLTAAIFAPSALVLSVVVACGEPPAATAGKKGESAPAPAKQDEPPAPAKVTPLAEAVHRQKGGGAVQIRELARGRNAFLGKLEMAPGGMVPEHRDATEEYIHILTGGGKFTIDGQTYEVGPGTTIYMPANALVSFENGSEPLVAIQVFAGPDPAAKYEAWEKVAPGE